MNEWNRRDMIRAVTAGAAAVGVAPAGVAEGARAQRLRQRQVRVLRRAREHVLPAAALGLSSAQRATVAMCQSFDAEVWLEIVDGPAGFVALEPRGFMLAAAAQAAGRSLWVRYFGHDPDGAGGLGQFAGALVALDPSDLSDGEDES